MKYSCFQLSTGLIFRTLQEVVFTSAGQSIDKQAIIDTESSLQGSLSLGNKPIGRFANDMIFNSKDIVASWVEL